MADTRFREEAQEELLEAIRYYARHSRRVAADFVTEVERALGVLANYPESGHTIRPGVRRMVLRSFPYSLIYSPESDGLLILAVMAHAKRPGYWADRL